MDYLTRFRESSLTLQIVGVTLVCWAIVALFGLQGWAFGFGGFIPLRFGPFELPGALPPILTPLSATLLHADLFHIGFNMLLMFYCGRQVEQALGPGPLALLYVLGAYVSAGGHYLFNAGDPAPMVGASGAVSAVIGAYAMLYSRPRQGVGGTRHVISLAVAWIVIQLLIGFSTMGSPSRIAIVAHIFGFVLGLALAKPLLAWKYRDA